MKRYITTILSLVLMLSAWAVEQEEPVQYVASEEANSSFICQNLKNFFHNVESYGRIGYSIGGTAPLGIPAEIRKLNKYVLQPNVSFGVDLLKPVSERWGVIAGVRYENKAMHIDASVKNYHMQLTQGGQSLEGMFTGNNDSQAVQWAFTVPVLGTYNVNNRWRLKFGPYFSYITDRNFSGFAYDGYLRVGDPTGAKIYLGSTDEERGNYDFHEDVRRLQWGLDLGVDFFFTRKLGVYADLTWGLSGFFKGSFKTLDQTLYPIYGTIGIAYKIK